MKWLVSYLGDHFIPHEGNDHQPHFLRTKTALLLATILFTAEALYLVSTLIILPKSDMFAAVLASILVEQTNERRVTESAGTLEWSPILELAAQMKANDMAEKGYFSHNTPDGKTPWYWFRLAGYDYVAAGENLAVNFVDSRDITEAWMRSPTHRANILNKNYTEIGIATARGMYKGREAIFVVQLFGRPRGTPAINTQQHVATGTTAGRQIVGIHEQGVLTQRPLAALTRPEALGESINEISTSIPSESTVREDFTKNVSSEGHQPPTRVIAGPSERRANIVARLIATPRHVSLGFGMFFFALFIVALGLNIFIKIRIQHPQLIANGVLLAGVAMTLILMNAAITAALGTI